MDTPTYGVATTQQDMPLFDSSYSVDSGRGSQLNSKQNGAQGVGNAKFDNIKPEEQQPYYKQSAQYGSWWPNLENNRLQIPTENPIFADPSTKETYLSSRVDGFTENGVSFGPQFDVPSERAFPLRSAKYPDPVEKENFDIVFKNHIAKDEEWGTTIFGSILAIIILWIVAVFVLGGPRKLAMFGSSRPRRYSAFDTFDELL